MIKMENKSKLLEIILITFWMETNFGYYRKKIHPRLSEWPPSTVLHLKTTSQHYKFFGITSCYLCSSQTLNKLKILSWMVILFVGGISPLILPLGIFTHLEISLGQWEHVIFKVGFSDDLQLEAVRELKPS